MATEGFVRSFLRPSEELVGVLHVSIIPQWARKDIRPKGLHTVQFDPPYRYQGQLLIALVKHHNETRDVEEGGLLFLDYATTSGAVKAVDALPIIARVSLSLIQYNLYPSSKKKPEDRGLPEEAPWYVAIDRDVQDANPHLFAVRGDTNNLRIFLEEYRRLREIAMTLPVSDGLPWIYSYFSHLTSRCLDLRIRNRPLYQQLSFAVAGSPGDDVSDTSIIRRNWIEFTSAQKASTGVLHHLKIRLGTFNVNGKPPSQDLSSWLRGFASKSQVKNGWISPLKLSPFEVSVDPLHSELGEKNTLNDSAAIQAFEDPDIFVLGFQELDLSAEALLYASSTLKEDEWLTAIFASLGEKGVYYEKLVSRQLVGMLLVVIVKKTLSSFTDIRSNDAGAGILGFMGNKGATAIRLEFVPKRSSEFQTITYQPLILTFVNAHLAAADEMVEYRNSNYIELSKRLRFGGDLSNPRDYTIFHSDVLFWIGDLNYRLDLADEEIRTLLTSHGPGVDNIKTLLTFDQLKSAIRKHEAFVGFEEPPISYFPTYRLGLGATVAKDRLGYDMKRKPAWTDRVLYMTSSDTQVVPLAYRNHPEITMSDHFPVSADFGVSWTLVDQFQREKTMMELYRELAMFEESPKRSKIKVQPYVVELGSVKFKQPVRREVILQNEGDIPCAFRFVGSDTNRRPVPSPWLHVEPMTGLIRPHESMVVTLVAHVDEKSAAELNFKPHRMECTLVLHTLLGKDYFIAVSGDYEYTCFGNTLERLTRLTGPIRQFKSEEELRPFEEASHPPKALTRLTDWMMKNATDEPFHELFNCPADEGLCRVVRECLDTGDAFPEVGPDGDHRRLAIAIASTFVLLLDTLVEPVVPAHLHARCLMARDKDTAYDVVNELPEATINVWISLMAFLHFLTQQSTLSQNDNAKADVTGPSVALQLATIFSPILLRDGPSMVPRASPAAKRNFILFFIE